MWGATFLGFIYITLYISVRKLLENKSLTIQRRAYGRKELGHLRTHWAVTEQGGAQDQRAGGTMRWVMASSAHLSPSSQVHGRRFSGAGRGQRTISLLLIWNLVQHLSLSQCSHLWTSPWFPLTLQPTSFHPKRLLPTVSWLGANLLSSEIYPRKLKEPALLLVLVWRHVGCTWVRTGLVSGLGADSFCPSRRWARCHLHCQGRSVSELAVSCE